MWEYPGNSLPKLPCNGEVKLIIGHTPCGRNCPALRGKTFSLSRSMYRPSDCNAGSLSTALRCDLLTLTYLYISCFYCLDLLILFINWFNIFSLLCILSEVQIGKKAKRHHRPVIYIIHKINGRICRLNNSTSRPRKGETHTAKVTLTTPTARHISGDCENHIHWSLSRHQINTFVRRVVRAYKSQSVSSVFSLETLRAVARSELTNWWNGRIVMQWKHDGGTCTTNHRNIVTY